MHFSKYIMIKIPVIILLSVFLASCYSPRKGSAATASTTSHQDNFWQSLQQLCGKAYGGTILSAPPNDTVFKGKTLLMHVRSCGPAVIRIPFFTGEDRSRTWVFTKTKEQLSLKHDHRHADGTPDSITQYGGHTANSGSASVQLFPADQVTTNLLPAAAANVWWVELVPGKHFIYNLRRMGTDRLFSIRFDLTQEMVPPGPPWGWKD